MSKDDTNLKSENNNKENNEMNSNNDIFGKAVEFCKKNVRYIAIAGLFIVLVLVVVKFSGKKDDAAPVGAVSTEEVAQSTEKSESYAVDAYPAINDLISRYYTSYAAGDVEALSTMATPISDTEKSYIGTFSQFVEQYSNISCYTKKGLDDSSYIVSVYLEIKFKDIETTAPGLDFFYVKTDEAGNLFIDNLYSQFNMSEQEQTLDTNVSSMIEEFEQQEDVIALQTDVQTKYDAAITADEKLKEMVQTTIPGAISTWVADAKAAAKAAEEQAKAAEEQAKADAEAAAKAAEEQAKADAEAAARAAAETVFAISKVNVRSDANETAEVLGQLEQGAQTSRLENREDGWSKIDYNNGQQGYVKSEFLTADAAAAQPAAPDAAPTEPAAGGGTLAEGTVITLKESINIRESMSQDSAKIATAFSGEKVTVVMSYAEGWTKVNYSDKIGYIKTDLLQ